MRRSSIPTDFVSEDVSINILRTLAYRAGAKVGPVVRETDTFDIRGNLLYFGATVDETVAWLAEHGVRGERFATLGEITAVTLSLGALWSLCRA